MSILQVSTVFISLKDVQSQYLCIYIYICCRKGTRFWRWTDRQRYNPQIKIDNAENSFFHKKMKWIMINNYYNGLRIYNEKILTIYLLICGLTVGES